jgi:hypothetical protein
VRSFELEAEKQILCRILVGGQNPKNYKIGGKIPDFEIGWTKFRILNFKIGGKILIFFKTDGVKLHLSLKYN